VPTTEIIADLAEHPDAEALARFDHPTWDLSAWRGTLIAKAWIGDDLACFFARVGDALSHYILVFHASRGFRPVMEGQDMREAVIGSVFRLDVMIKPDGRTVVLSADLAA